MVRKYGQPPYSVAVIHGGPGAIGSVACIARELSVTMGVIEPLQSKYSINELIGELNNQLKENSNAPLTLIGHSWGAFLSLLYAGSHPENVKQIILVGCAPLADEYVPSITERRLRNLSEDEGRLFLQLLDELEDAGKNDSLQQLEKLVEKSDNYQLLSLDEDALPVDNIMYSRIWNEAKKMRSSGELIDRIKKVNRPVYIIQGEYDPHPIEGITEPLELAGIPFKHHLLPHCGHSPFKEKLAIRQFYSILQAIIEERHSYGNL